MNIDHSGFGGDWSKVNAIIAVLLGWRIRQFLGKKKAAAQQIRARAAT